MLPGIALRLVRERSVESPPTEEEIAADPEAAPSRRRLAVVRGRARVGPCAQALRAHST